MPPDVVIARVVKAHTRAMLALAGSAIMLALLGVAALSLAGAHGRDAPMIAGLTLLSAGGVLALVAAAVVLRGLLRVLRHSGEPGSRQARTTARAGQPLEVLQATTATLLTVIKIVIATAVAGIVIWAFVAPSGVVGAVVGAILVVQVAVFVGLIRVGILHRALHSMDAPVRATG